MLFFIMMLTKPISGSESQGSDDMDDTCSDSMPSLLHFNNYLASLQSVWSLGNLHFHSQVGPMTSPVGQGVITFGNGLFIALDLQEPSAQDFYKGRYLLQPGYLWPNPLLTSRVVLGSYGVQVLGTSRCLVAHTAREYTVCTSAYFIM